MPNIWNQFHPDLVKLANYMGFFIEWKWHVARGDKEFYNWIGYGGIRFSRIEVVDPFTGIANTPMPFEEYCEWNDSKFWQNPGKVFIEEQDKEILPIPLPLFLRK